MQYVQWEGRGHWSHPLLACGGLWGLQAGLALSGRTGGWSCRGPGKGDNGPLSLPRFLLPRRLTPRQT